LIDGGWLAVSPSEASQALFTQFVTLNCPGVILYQKGEGGPRVNQVPWVSPAAATPMPDAPPAPLPMTPLVAESRPEEHQPEPPAFAVVARALANQGRLTEALAWCDRWLAADKMDAAGHYLRAVVLLEHGHQDDARGALQRVLYLEPTFVLAHFALGSLARSRDKHDEADRHFANTLDLLGRLLPHDVLPESDGLTAGRLTETITAMTELGNPR
jgi:chemotaxis protein methyltransferase CheR